MRESETISATKIRERLWEPKLPPTAWEKQAEGWHGPEFASSCCGTEFRAMTPVFLVLLVQAHMVRH